MACNVVKNVVFCYPLISLSSLSFTVITFPSAEYTILCATLHFTAPNCSEYSNTLNNPV